MVSLNISKNILDLLFSLKPQEDIPSNDLNIKMIKDLPKIYHQNKCELIIKLNNEYNNLNEIYLTKIVNYIYPDYYTNNINLIIISNIVIRFNEDEYIPYKIIDERAIEKILYYLIDKNIK
jgi:hypothetical protein